MCLLIWLLRLLLSRRARSRFAARPVLGVVLMLVLALAASFYLSFQYQVWQIDREFARRDAARRVTLAQAQTLGGVLMPAGARLTLAKEGELETFTEALFDPPAPAFGLRVSRIERYLHTDYDSKTYEELRRYPHTIHLWGEGPQQVEAGCAIRARNCACAWRTKGRGQNSPNACWPRAMPSKGRGALAGRNRVAAYGEASSTRMGTASR